MSSRQCTIFQTVMFTPLLLLLLVGCWWRSLAQFDLPFFKLKTSFNSFLHIESVFLSFLLFLHYLDCLTFAIEVPQRGFSLMNCFTKINWPCAELHLEKEQWIYNLKRPELVSERKFGLVLETRINMFNSFSSLVWDIKHILSQLVAHIRFIHKSFTRSTQSCILCSCIASSTSISLSLSLSLFLMEYFTNSFCFLSSSFLLHCQC